MNPEFKKSDKSSIGSSLREVGASAREVVRDEVHLIQAEIQDSVRGVRSHLTQAAVFGALTAISVLPFVAFLVIGLGRLMNHNYWASSLIVALVCAVIGGSLAMRAYRRISAEDLTLPRSREGLERSREALSEKVREMKDITSSRRSA